jgi:hypothetical protein
MDTIIYEAGLCKADFSKGNVRYSAQQVARLCTPSQKLPRIDLGEYRSFCCALRRPTCFVQWRVHSQGIH